MERTPRPEEINKWENKGFINDQMRDQLLEIWEDRFDELYSDYKSASREKGKQTNAEVQRQEEVDYLMWHLDSGEVVEEYGFDNAELKEREDGYFEVSLEEHFMDDRLPEGYGYKGGAARCLLERNLGINKHSEPRDIDLIRLANEEPEDGMDNDLAKRYMPEDFEHGHGVEWVDDPDAYMDSRDLTINELYATDEKVVATEACIKDSVRRILRVTDHEREQWGGTGPKMLAKMVRFYTESIIDTGMGRIEDSNRLNTAMIQPFFIALNLDKAMDQGVKYAREYVSKMRDSGHLPEEARDVERAIEYLKEELKDDRFYFRNAPVKQYEHERKDLPKQLGMGHGHDAA